MYHMLRQTHYRSEISIIHLLKRQTQERHPLTLVFQFSKVSRLLFHAGKKKTTLRTNSQECKIVIVLRSISRGPSFIQDGPESLGVVYKTKDDFSAVLTNI